MDFWSLSRSGNLASAAAWSAGLFTRSAAARAAWSAGLFTRSNAAEKPDGRAPVEYSASFSCSSRSAVMAGPRLCRTLKQTNRTMNTSCGPRETLADYPPRRRGRYETSADGMRILPFATEYHLGPGNPPTPRRDHMGKDRESESHVAP